MALCEICATDHLSFSSLNVGIDDKDSKTCRQIDEFISKKLDKSRFLGILLVFSVKTWNIASNQVFGVFCKIFSKF